MSARATLWIVAVVAWIALPWMLWLGADLYTLAFHQLYYWPFAQLLGQPFFTSDSELGFLVTTPGRLLVAGLYVLLAGAIHFWRRRRRR